MPNETITEKKEKSALNLLNLQQVKDLFEIGRRIIKIKRSLFGDLLLLQKRTRDYGQKECKNKEKVSVRRPITDKKTVKIREGVRKKANYGQNDCQNKKKCP
jgi:hypothetical protein